MSSRVAIASSAASSSPIRTVPSSSAIVAGTAPAARTASSSSRAIRALSGRGRPWAMIVDSSATTGPPRDERLGDLGRDLDHVRALRGLTISGRSTRV